jgi:HAD superfamily hydrolase (TIGR01549 family)
MSDPAHSPLAILFDMDGTITEPMLNFPLIKAEMGIGGEPILEAMERMEPRRRAEAEAILLRHEEHAAENSVLNPGCRELIAWLTDHGMRTALITRNSGLSVRTVLARHRLSFDCLVTREDPPPKPRPEPVWLACKRLRVDRNAVWMIGDGWHDVAAGSAAGVRTVWLSHGKQRQFESVPWREVQDLHEVAEMLNIAAR